MLEGREEGTVYPKLCVRRETKGRWCIWSSEPDDSCTQLGTTTQIRKLGLFVRVDLDIVVLYACLVKQSRDTGMRRAG